MEKIACGGVKSWKSNAFDEGGACDVNAVATRYAILVPEQGRAFPVARC